MILLQLDDLKILQLSEILDNAQIKASHQGDNKQYNDISSLKRNINMQICGQRPNIASYIDSTAPKFTKKNRTTRDNRHKINNNEL